MFVHEEGNELYLGQAIPRYWMADGKAASIQRAASHFGPLSLRFTSQAAKGTIQAELDPPKRNPPDRIYLRCRHPDGKAIRQVTLNGKAYDQLVPEKDWVVLPGNLEGRQVIVAQY
jgi:hypothetical protein